MVYPPPAQRLIQAIPNYNPPKAEVGTPHPRPQRSNEGKIRPLRMFAVV